MLTAIRSIPLAHRLAQRSPGLGVGPHSPAWSMRPESLLAPEDKKKIKKVLINPTTQVGHNKLVGHNK
jgi:hypothetical protein